MDIFEAEKVYRYIDEKILLNNKEIIAKNGISLSDWDSYKNFSDKLTTAKNMTEEIYSEHTWYKTEKKSSYIMGLLLSCKKYLDNINVTIDEAVIIICSLYNYGGFSFHVKVPDRYLVGRSQTSQQKLNEVLYILNKNAPDTFDLKRDHSELKIKINKKQLEADNYISVKAKSFREKDREYLRMLRDRFETIYFYPYSDRTIRAKLNEIILGISIAYTEMAKEHILTVERLRDIELYGEREDIKYLEVPIHIISRATGIPSKKIMQHLNTLSRSSNYIKKHTEVYVNGQFTKHYYREDYTLFCNRKDYRKAESEEGRPIVTPFSYILFPNNFEGSKLDKRIQKNYRKYQLNVIRELTYSLLDEKYGRTDNYYKDAFQLEEKEVDQVVDKYITCEGDDISEMFDPENKWGSLVDRNKLKQINGCIARKDYRVRKSDLKSNGRYKNGIQLCFYLYKHKKFLEDCPMDEYKSQIKLYELIVDLIKQEYNKWKNDNIKVFKQLVHKLKYYELESDIGIFI